MMTYHPSALQRSKVGNQSFITGKQRISENFKFLISHCFEHRTLGLSNEKLGIEGQRGQNHVYSLKALLCHT